MQQVKERDGGNHIRAQERTLIIDEDNCTQERYKERPRINEVKDCNQVRARERTCINDQSKHTQIRAQTWSHIEEHRDGRRIIEYAKEQRTSGGVNEEFIHADEKEK